MLLLLGIKLLAEDLNEDAIDPAFPAKLVSPGLRVDVREEAVAVNPGIPNFAVPPLIAVCAFAKSADNDATEPTVGVEADAAAAVAVAAGAAALASDAACASAFVLAIAVKS